jgi:hypothetical protein
VIAVLTSPAVTSSEMKALTGIGLGLGEGDGDGGGVGMGEGDGDGTGDGAGDAVGGVGEGVEVAAISTNQRGRVTKTRSNFMRSSVGYITRVARGWTTRTLVRGSARLGRGRAAAAASEREPRLG